MNKFSNAGARPANNRNNRAKTSPPKDNSAGPKAVLRVKTTAVAARASRGEAMRAQKRTLDDALKQASQFLPAEESEGENRANFVPFKTDDNALKIVGLGGMDDTGSMNMLLVEYKDSAVIIDTGMDLGVDLPGINYGIADTSYLETIRHKIKAYVITHGHLDHIGGLPHIVPKFPAPVYGSRFTVGRVEEIFGNFGLPMPQGFELQTVVMNETTHEKLKVGEFFVELVRVTHAIPGSTAVVLDTPIGKIINTGDFRLDPNPLDHEKTDTARFEELAKEGVLALLSESTCTERPGHTPSESTIEPSFDQLIKNADGRVFVSMFSTNINRIQMVVNAAVKNGRKIAMDGRSMMSTLEMAVRIGYMKIPKGTFVPMSSVATLQDSETIVVCTGSQGEPNSALQRMSSGGHKYVKLKPGDTVVLSSTPIPESGNDKLVGAMINELLRKNVNVFRHETHQLDGCGPLHVSGHASIEEYREMIQMTRPKFFIPIYGGYRSKKRHIDIALECGIPKERMVNAGDGEMIVLTKDKLEIAGTVPNGTILIDESGAQVSSVVVKDRLLLAEEGLMAVVLTIDRNNGQLVSSPDIISRGFIHMKAEEDLMNAFRTELKRVVSQRFMRVDLDRFKIELKEHIVHFLYEQTQASPIVIPVVNLVGKSNGQQQQQMQVVSPKLQENRRPNNYNQPRNNNRPNQSSSQNQPQRFNNDNNSHKQYFKEAKKEEHSDDVVVTQEKIQRDHEARLAALRAQLLGQDGRTD